MANFQRIVLFVALAVLILVMLFVGVALKYSKDTHWPPMVPSCPDYWLYDNSGNCVNTKSLGSCTAPPGQKFYSKNFNDPIFNTSDSSCQKYKWAKSCGVSWDGITYGVNNPCLS